MNNNHYGVLSNNNENQKPINQISLHRRIPSSPTKEQTKVVITKIGVMPQEIGIGKFTRVKEEMALLKK